ncbi:hypothetical protein QFC22_003855 [Naganishia vaughanmartiniae]|uniref:Uncharacterized protein n=1 Tax=Naganishia vaughanmartiniae TaxID=1424756 RepID=A0ACC2X5H3_9TREE|nr:hypothetical protein QFC22_003855 [Naganishia vaughanmartiniae]
MNDTNLHVYYLERNLSGFRKYLEGTDVLPDAPSGLAYSRSPAGPSSGPRSWTLSALSSLPTKKPDPNARDTFGRTVLHLVCSTSPGSPTYSRSFDFLATLLAHPHINVNITDYESGYTALHRAMWSGNLRAARALLERADTDLGIKDTEGLTAMDLWNSSCAGTNPPETGAKGTDLYTWGSNRNCTLGLPDSADRALPERVNLLTKLQARLRSDSENFVSSSKSGTQHRSASESDDSESGRDDHSQADDALRAKFDQVGVKQIAMSKFHTAILTTESRGNLSLSGVSGSVSRLGQRGVHSQYALVPMQDSSGLKDVQVTKVALGTDHALVVTSKGYVYSWGGNRFAQLGYVIDDGSEGSGGPSVASAPSFANSSSSTSTEKSIVQSTPRRIIGPLKKEVIIGCAASRLSSACWTADKGGLWTWGTNMGHLGYDKAMTSGGMQVMPRKVTGISQGIVDVAMTASSKTTITRITSCGMTFGALSSLGDVFTFSLANPIDMDIKDGGKGFTVKPQMVWALRKRFTAVKDVALGTDGTVIICTHSGHVYVRQRQGNKWSYKRVQHLQRIIKVAANESGSFAAIRSDASPGKFDIDGPALAEDLLNLLPHMRREVEIPPMLISNGVAPGKFADDEDEDDEDDAVQRDIDVGGRIVSVMKSWNAVDEIHTLGTDLYFAVQGRRIPVHRFILVNRIPVFAAILEGRVPTPLQNFISANVEDVDPSQHEITFPSTSFLTVLLFLQYVYSDELVAIWDGRIQSRLQAGFGNMSYVEATTVKRELIELAESMQLDHLRGPLASTGKVTIPPTLSSTWGSFFISSQTIGTAAHRQCDAVLKLADRKVYVSSLLLRARCPTFDAMFEDAEFTEHRRNEDGHGHIVIDLSNLKWRSLKLVLRWLHDGNDAEIFDYQPCSVIVRRHVNTMNAAALAAEASFHNAQELKSSVFWYIACNLETMMENGLLDDMDIRILNDLTDFVRDRQAEKLPVTRSGILLDMAMEKYKDWMVLQDFSEPRLRIPRDIKPKSPRLTSTAVPTAISKSKGKSKATPSNIRSSPQMTGSKMFNEELDMDDLMLPVAAPTLVSADTSASASANSVAKHSPWKSQAVEAKRVDLRSILSETKTSQPTNGKATPARSIASATPTRQVGFSPAASPVGSYQAKTPLDRAPSTWRTTPTTPAQPSGLSGTSTPIRPTATAQASFPSLSSAAIPAQTKSGINATRPGAMPTAGRSVSGQKPDVSQGSQPTRSNVIVPTRQAVAAARKNSEPAWTMAAPFATPPPPIAISPINYASATVSLLEIQRREQAAQHEADNQPAPMSIREIQEHERKAEEARQVEAEFERWWMEEQARLKVESKPISDPAGSNKRTKKKNPPAGNKDAKDRKDGQKVAGDRQNTSSRTKGEDKKPVQPAAARVADGDKQHRKIIEQASPNKPRKSQHNNSSAANAPSSTRPNNTRAQPPSKHTITSHTHNHDKPQQQQSMVNANGNGHSVPDIASRVNVAASAFVPQQTIAPPVFNPRAAAFVPPSANSQR